MRPDNRRLSDADDRDAKLERELDLYVTPPNPTQPLWGTHLDIWNEYGLSAGGDTEEKALTGLACQVRQEQDHLGRVWRAIVKRLSEINLTKDRP